MQLACQCGLFFFRYILQVLGQLVELRGALAHLAIERVVVVFQLLHDLRLPLQAFIEQLRLHAQRAFACKRGRDIGNLQHAHARRHVERRDGDSLADLHRIGAERVFVQRQQVLVQRARQQRRLSLRDRLVDGKTDTRLRGFRPQVE